MTEATPLRLAGWSDDLPHLVPEEVARPGSFEWWYFDCETADGSSLVVVVRHKDPDGVPPLRRVRGVANPAVRVEYAGRAGAFRHVVDADRWDVHVDDAACTIDLGVARLTISRGADDRIAGYALRVDAGPFRAELTVTPLQAGFTPLDRGRYFAAAGDDALWNAVVFAAPATRVQGTVRVGDAVEDLDGRGYHDHPWGTVPLLRSSGSWHWGRLASPNAALVFADVLPAHGFSGRLRFAWLGVDGTWQPELATDVAIDATDWTRQPGLPLLHGRYPRRLVVTSAQLPARLETSFRSVLLDEPVYVRSSVAATFSGTGRCDGEASGWLERVAIPWAMRGTFQWLDRLQCARWTLPVRGGRSR